MKKQGQRLWLSNKRMTVFAQINNETIMDTSPIIRKFKGQKIANLVNWMRRMGKTEVVELPVKKP